MSMHRQIHRNVSRGTICVEERASILAALIAAMSETFYLIVTC